jgi:hypothetical protein
MDYPRRKDALYLRARLLLTAAAVTLAALVFPLGARAAEPGLSPDLTWGTSASDQDRTGAALQDSGSKWVRLNVEWSATEPTQGSYDPWMLAHYDRAVDVARANGQKVLMLASTSPNWASGSSDKQAPPANPATYAAFLQFLANRWGAKIDAWEIWNEPNYSRFWPGGADPTAYTALLKASYVALKGQNPAAKVVFGGPSLNDYKFIEGAYAAGAKGYFDVMSVHPYSCAKSPETVSRDASGRITANSFTGYREVRASMLARGDDKPIWFTEFGWSTTSQTCGVSEATQADYLTRAFKLIEQDRYVQVALWYNLRNNYWSHDADDVESRYGLTRTDYSHKPSYGAFKAYAHSAPSSIPPPSQISINVAPVVTLTGPAAGSIFTNTLKFRAAASDDRGVARVEFWLDRRLIRSDTGAPYSYNWKLKGANKSISYRAHTVTAKAFDAQGLVGTCSARVRRASTTASASRARHKRARQHKRTRHARRHAEHSKVIAGHVRGAHSGRVKLRLQSLRHGRWHNLRTLKASVSSHGNFKRNVSVRHGQWRLRASIGGGHRHSASSLRFRT